MQHTSTPPGPPTPAALQKRLAARRAEQGITTLPSCQRHRPAVRKAIACHQRALRWMIDQAWQRVQDAATPTDRRYHQWERDDLIAELGRHIARWGDQS